MAKIKPVLAALVRLTAKVKEVCAVASKAAEDGHRDKIPLPELAGGFENSQDYVEQ